MEAIFFDELTSSALADLLQLCEESRSVGAAIINHHRWDRPFGIEKTTPVVDIHASAPSMRPVVRRPVSRNVEQATQR